MSKKTKEIKLLTIDFEATIIEALKQMDQLERKLLIVTKADKFFSLVSIGDIQRAIIKNYELTSKLFNILRTNIHISHESDELNLIKEKILASRAEFMPILDYENNIKQVIFFEDLFKGKEINKKVDLKLPIVIMAGGKGTRLKPLTNVIPKPILPIGNKTIIEEIMDRFVNVGCNQFYISVNYKSETIKHYINELGSHEYLIDYFQEEKPLGTAGSLFLLKEKIKSTFFVSNCDIIIEEDYSEILKYHQENKNELTIVSALKHYPIPYGTIKTETEGLLIELVEKPELTFQINTGFYILEPNLLDEIPENEFFHITSLIENIIKRKGRVGVFPVSEGSWKDIGEWKEYLRYISI